MELNDALLVLPIDLTGLQEFNLNLSRTISTLDFESLKRLATQVRAQIKDFKSYRSQTQTSAEIAHRKLILPDGSLTQSGLAVQPPTTSVTPTTEQQTPNNNKQRSTVNSKSKNSPAQPQFGIFSEFASHQQPQQKPISNTNGFGTSLSPPQLHSVPNPSPVLRPPQINGAPIPDRLSLLAGLTNPQLTVPPQVLLHPPQHRLTRNQEQVLQQQLNQQMQRIQQGQPQFPPPFPQLAIDPRFQGRPLGQPQMLRMPLTPQQIQQQHRGQFQAQFQQRLQQQMQNQHAQYPYSQQQHPQQSYTLPYPVPPTGSPNLSLPARLPQASTVYNQSNGSNNKPMKQTKFPHQHKAKAKPKKNFRIKKSKLDKYEFPLPSEGFLSAFMNGAQMNNSKDPEDDDLVEQAMLISLLDPLSGRKLETPLRSRFCSHIECFDLWSFIEINRLRPFKIGVKRDPPTASV
ncbi:unnamed protein product [Ambrosiozyma monospora]|uniref:Unnamed protein product n=1 Tax=Ambrosiozyma monospora TaxID=43982 RepID=A0ACB5T7K3_AMBMO|nr:unnamed protein product [Ambrosiozyma monospora]